MVNTLLTYSKFYGEAPDFEKLQAQLKSIPLEELVATFSGVNALVNPMTSSSQDNSPNTQIAALFRFFLDGQEQSSVTNLNCYPILKKVVHNGRLQVHMFSRVTCLAALQEVLRHNDYIEDKKEYYFTDRERIFKFLLAINERILEYDKGYESVSNSIYWEFMMFKELAHNQYYLNNNILQNLERSFHLLDSFSKDENLGKHLSDYLYEKIKVKKFADAFYHILGILINGLDKNLKMTFIKILDSEKEVLMILDWLSQKANVKSLSLGQPEALDFLALKKAPLFKSRRPITGGVITYIILDTKLLADKLYSLFVNDFWFDYVKPKSICSRKVYGGLIGKNFFEPFIDKMLTYSFKNNKRITYLPPAFLTIPKSGGEHELADFYIRQSKNVMLIQAKSNYLPLVKYKTVVTLDDFEKLDRDEIFERFGLNQLIEKSISKFNELRDRIPDKGLKKIKKVSLYPILLVNEPIISAQFSTLALRSRFSSMLEKAAIPTDSDRLIIHELCVMNIADLQSMEQSLHDGDESIFNLVRHHLQFSNPKNVHKLGKSVYLRNFSDSIKKLISRKAISIPSRQLFGQLIRSKLYTYE